MESDCELSPPPHTMDTQFSCSDQQFLHCPQKFYTLLPDSKNYMLCLFSLIILLTIPWAISRDVALVLM